MSKQHLATYYQHHRQKYVKSTDELQPQNPAFRFKTSSVMVFNVCVYSGVLRVTMKITLLLNGCSVITTATVFIFSLGLVQLGQLILSRHPINARL